LVKSLDIPADKLLEMDIGALEKLFPIKTTINNRRYDELMQYLDSLKTEVNKPGFTLLYHYNEYSQQLDNPYSYTQFVEHYNRRYRKVKSSMKLTHQPGETMMIDFAGKHLYLTDKETGEQIPVEIYVSILPHSQYTYVQAVMSQKREDLLDCIAGSLAYYGGVPQAIISDNLK
jgi:transposase